VSCTQGLPPDFLIVPWLSECERARHTCAGLDSEQFVVGNVHLGVNSDLSEHELYSRGSYDFVCTSSCRPLVLQGPGMDVLVLE